MRRPCDIYAGTGADATVPAEIRMLRLASGHLPARAVHVFAALGIADILQRDAATADEIAGQIGAHGPSLYRLLRFLSTIGVVLEEAENRFSLTPLGATLRGSGIPVIKDNTLLLGSTLYWDAIGRLRERVMGSPDGADDGLFDYLKAHPEEIELFNRTMGSLSHVVMPAIVKAYDFSRFSCVVDVGGGQGAFLAGILGCHPGLSGILYDRPDVIAAAVIDDRIAARLRTVGGDFFQHMPEGGDLYVLRQILHDWSDARSVDILRQCRKAVPPQGRLLIVETASPESKNDGNNWAALDLLMMVLMNGRERTPEDFDALFADSGFARTRVVATGSPFHLIEARPR